MTFYTSKICDEHCDHRHKSSAAAEKCAARRIANGELRYRMGKTMPLQVSADELAQYVGTSYDGQHVH